MVQLIMIQDIDVLSFQDSGPDEGEAQAILVLGRSSLLPVTCLKLSVLA